MSVGTSSLHRRIFYAARDGMAITLYALLESIDEKDLPEYLESPVEEDGQKFTPLLAAAINGRDNVVKMLLSRFHPNIEGEGVVLIDGYVIEGAAALWCAAGAGHFNVVKLLVEHGADVNHATKTESSPLRAACFDGRIPIIQFLINRGADIHKTNKFKNTCLMLAAYRGHLDAVSYLLTNKADPNAQANCGSTALHLAAEHGHLDIMKRLLKGDAKILKTKTGLTPLLVAAEHSRAKVVEYFICKSMVCKQDAVDALELLGASYANDREYYDLEKVYYYLHWAMTERENNPEAYTPKVFLPPIKAYDFHVECRTLKELEAIKNNSNALHMESLVIRERILGSNNPEVTHPVVFRGALFADIGQFDRCVELWLHAMHLRYTHTLSVRKDLLRFAQVFAQMMHTGVEVSFSQLMQVLEVTLQELIRNKLALTQPRQNCSGEIVENAVEILEDNIVTTLYLMVIATKVMKEMPPEEKATIHQIVYKMVKLNLATSNGSTLLHLAVNADTPVDEFHTKYVCKFPDAATARLLIQCGADVNIVDKAGNTPLHIIVGYTKPITDFMTLHVIITKLLEAGSHIDQVNNKGESPFDSALTAVAEIILKSQYEPNLKCLAARAVRKYQLPYKGIVPTSLAVFTDLHGSANSQKKFKL